MVRAGCKGRRPPDGDQRVIVAGNASPQTGTIPALITPADMRHLMTGGTNGGEQVFTCDFRITKNAETHVVNPFAGVLPRVHAQQHLLLPGHPRPQWPRRQGRFSRFTVTPPVP